MNQKSAQEPLLRTKRSRPLPRLTIPDRFIGAKILVQTGIIVTSL